jgi:5-methylcytosine-specific restriction endonuclease McrA
MLAERFPGAFVPSSIRERVEPLSKSRFRVEFTAREQLVSKLERCRDLMSHANPSRDLAVVVERAVDLLLADLERKRIARTTRSRSARSVAGSAGSALASREAKSHYTTRSVRTAKGAHITNAVRRRVFERDGLRCTFVSADGRRCEASAFLELDHAEPKGLGGESDAGNLRVLCRAHNQLAAERFYGRDRMERCRHFRQQKRTRTTENQPCPHGELDAHAFEAETSKKVLLALKGLGFPDARARQAIAEAGKSLVPTQHFTLEQALRRALLFATAGTCR